MKINEKNLCVFASQPPYDCEGFLNKRGEVNKAFQRRYFVLKGNLLFYFEKKGDKEPLGLIIVEGCTIELSEDLCDQYCFEIAFNGNRSYVLAADTQEQMETWMKALTCAGYEYKKLMVAELQRQLEEIEGSRNKLVTENTTNVVPTIPKPPPRRQNPFNRPAPPVPAANGNELPVTFINGHFGISSQRAAYGLADSFATDSAVNLVSRNPVPPPRGQPPTFTAGKSEFYQPLASSQQQQQQQEQQSMSSAKPTSVFPAPKSAANDFQNQNFSTSSALHFEKLHEKFRELVMKDVLNYHAQQQLRSKPLIDL